MNEDKLSNHQIRIRLLGTRSSLGTKACAKKGCKTRRAKAKPKKQPPPLPKQPPPIPHRPRQRVKPIREETGLSKCSSGKLLGGSQTRGFPQPFGTAYGKCRYDRVNSRVDNFNRLMNVRNQYGY